MAERSGFSLVRRLLPFARPHLRYVWVMLAAMVLESPVTLVMPLILRTVVDGAVGQASRQGLGSWGLLLAALTLASVLLKLVVDYCSMLFRQRVFTGLRLKLFEHLQSLSLRYYQDRETGQLMSRSLDDVGNLGGVMADAFGRGAISLLKAAACVAMLFYVEWRLAVGGLALALIVFVLQAATSGALRRRNRSVFEAWSALTEALHQAISGHYLVQATASEKREARRLAGSLHATMRAMLRRDLFRLWTGNVFELIAALMPTLIILGGVFLIAGGGFTVGGLFAFYIYLDLLFQSVGRLTAMNPALQTAFSALERIYEVLDARPELTVIGHGIRPPRLQGEVLLERVSFAYTEGREVLSGVDFRVSPRTMVALVGPSGAGKTTLAHLIPRFFDPTAGRLLVDGYEVRTLELASYRRQIGLVPQEVFLFDRTIAENIAYGRPRASRREIEAAAAAANADEFIAAMEQGYDTVIGERGVRLSGGQRQRIAIAREILRDPAILILDEATSSLDSQSEALVQQALYKLLADRTSFVIAHRLSTILRADVILVLDHGRIVAQGRHADLLAEEGLYYRLYHSQFLRHLEDGDLYGLAEPARASARS